MQDLVGRDDVKLHDRAKKSTSGMTKIFQKRKNRSGMTLYYDEDER